MVDSGPGRDMAGKAGARARRGRGSGWVGLGVTLYFNRRHVVSFMFSLMYVKLSSFGFFLMIDLLSDLFTDGHQ